MRVELAYMYLRPELSDIVAILSKPTVKIADRPRKGSGISYHLQSVGWSLLCATVLYRHHICVTR